MRSQLQDQQQQGEKHTLHTISLSPFADWSVIDAFHRFTYLSGYIFKPLSR